VHTVRLYVSTREREALRCIAMNIRAFQSNFLCVRKTIAVFNAPFCDPLRTIYINTARFEAFTTMKIQVEVLWIVTPCGVMIGHQSFGGPCCSHLQGEMEV
jgi:hypothetical protein